MPTIRISDETYNAIDELGGTFDTPDDVIQRRFTQSGYTGFDRDDDDDTDDTTHNDGAIDTWRITIQNGAAAETFSHRNQNEVMATVVNYLITDCDLIDALSPLPYTSSRGLPIVSETSSTSSGKKMREPRELSNGFYVETHASKGRKKTIVKELVDECECDVEFGTEWMTS